MNKTIIALAIAAALPVTAVADATISGTLTSKYRNTATDGSIDTDSMLRVDSSEVLANGMTATAGFAITADSDDDTENSGTASLTGDFGALTVGSIDADAAFQAGDVAGVVSNTTESTDGTSSAVYGIHYSGTAAGLTVAAQINAATNAAATASTQMKSTQMSATYEMNGLTVGYSYASAGAANESLVSDGQANADATVAGTAVNGTHDGIHEGQSAFGVSYAFGDLVVTAGKVNLKNASSVSPDAVISGTYTIAVDALTIVAQMDNYHSASDSNDYQINMSYAFTDAITISSEIDKNKTSTMVGTYTAGEMTATVAKTDDGTTDASIALDYGNADLTFGRVGARSGATWGTGVAGAAGDIRADAIAYSHVTYKVSF